MIITCPQCSARYKVKDGLIEEKGKKVKCKKCNAVFIAYPHKDSVLQRMHEDESDTADSTPSTANGEMGSGGLGAQPSASAGSDEERSQATVKVDRTKLDNYLRQSAGGQRRTTNDPKQATVKMDQVKFQQFLDQNRDIISKESGGSSQATVQVDRSKIDAFLKQSGAQRQDGSIEPATTVKVDPSQMNQFLVRGAQPPTPAPPARDPFQETGDSDPPMPDEPSFDDIGDKDDSLPEPPDFSGMDEDLSDFGFSSFANTDELTKQDDQQWREPQSELDFSGDDSGFSETPDESDFGDEHPPVFSEDDGPSTGTGSLDGMERRYVARVDGELYTDLTKEGIERWIREGRLLENDELAIEGTDQYRRADEHPEIVPFFIRYYGMQAEESESGEAPKKGMFSWLGGIFKK